MPDTQPRHFRFGTHRLDTVARELRGADGALVPLTGKAFDALCCLVAHHDRAVGKDELIATVWPGRVVEENNLTQAISALRRALGDEANAIVTVPGRGYRFVAPLLEEAAAVDAAATPPDGVTLPVAAAPAANGETVPIGFAASRRWTTPVLALALLVVASIGLVLAWRGGAPAASDAALARPAQAPGPAVAEPAAPGPSTTLAVLPFRSLSDGPGDPLLGLGLAETLISRVSGVSSLRVRSLSSSQRFAGPTQDSLEAGRALGADYVLEGTTQRRAARVRVNARLLAVRDGRALWSGTFDQDIARAFTLQDGLAEAVTSALALNLRASPASMRSPCDGADPLAYRAYLTGRYQLDRPQADRMRLALDAFKQAVDRDPSCARAYAGMAFAYRALVMTGDEEPRERFPLARAAAERALAIDPDLAEAHASLGFIQFWYDWDWAGAEASFKRAIALNPSSAQARMAYAHLLANLGRKAEAADQARQAAALDPLSPLILTLSSSFISGGGFRAEGKAMRAKSRELDPGFWTTMLNGGIPELRRALALCGNCSQAAAGLGAAYVEAGDRRAAEALLASMEARDRADYLPATSIAAVRLALGDRAGALDLLERAYEDRDVRMPFLRIDGRWKPLRDEPRFKALLRKMNFAPLPTPSGTDPAQGPQRKV